MSAAELTERERDMMAHCIGHPSAKGCSVHGGRNHYVTSSENDEVWKSLAARGLATARSSALLPDDETTYSLTEEGRAAVERDPRSWLPGHRYEIRFRACDWVTTVRCGTRAQARIVAARQAADAWGCSVFDALCEIASCRKAGEP